MLQFFTKVLLVEDESVAREILSFYLNTIFDEVIVAKDGIEGLNIYKDSFSSNKRIDLVLTDIKMPNMDGIEMLENIYKINQNQKFIIVSAYKDEEKLLKSIDLKVLSYFLKPLNIDNVMKLLIKAKDEVLEDKRKDEGIIKLNSIYTYNVPNKLLYENHSLVKLSKKETQALETLIQNRGKITDTSTLKKQIWGDVVTLDSTFRTVMKRLKDKIKVQDFIVSRKGQGYIIE
ncbi:response regulator [Sulfurospirillum arcachonense]|uniref:response regulator n=1 Tax=Sulfurospirillum arcachonense TaxID=57666 RepID=UPI0004692314|nr:response regulator [Sulfurospirillum arcachonense]